MMRLAQQLEQIQQRWITAHLFLLWGCAHGSLIGQPDQLQYTSAVTGTDTEAAVLGPLRPLDLNMLQR